MMPGSITLLARMLCSGVHSSVNSNHEAFYIMDKLRFILNNKTIFGKICLLPELFRGSGLQG